jgi:galactosylceramidase
MKKVLFSLVLFSFGASIVSAQVVRLSTQSAGKQFDGIGVVDGGGATSVLLKVSKANC